MSHTHRHTHTQREREREREYPFNTSTAVAVGREKTATLASVGAVEVAHDMRVRMDQSMTSPMINIQQQTSQASLLPQMRLSILGPWFCFSPHTYGNSGRARRSVPNAGRTGAHP